MRAKSSGWPAPGLANAQPPSCTKFANDPPPGADKAGKLALQLPGRGAAHTWSLTDALQAAFEVSQRAEPQCVTVSPH